MRKIATPAKKAYRANMRRIATEYAAITEPTRAAFVAVAGPAWKAMLATTGTVGPGSVKDLTYDEYNRLVQPTLNAHQAVERPAKVARVAAEKRALQEWMAAE